MEDKHLVRIFAAVVLGLVLITSSCQVWDYKIDKLRYTNNYCQTVVEGSQSPVWQKCKTVTTYQEK